METNISNATVDHAVMHSVHLGQAQPVQRNSLTLGAACVECLNGAGRWSGEERLNCRLLFQASSSATAWLDGGAVELELVAGSWIATLHDIEVENDPGCELYMISFPAALLSRSLAAQLHSAPAITGLPTQGAAQMCLELVRSCLAQAEELSSAVANTLGDSLVELAKLGVIEQSGATRGETMRETARARIQGFIHRNLADPDLTIERIANRMQCTKRYLHKVFSKEGETLNQYIWSQRLELCRVRLSRADLSDKSITEIAFACGFSNAAHFSRSFRARFGEAPRVYRRTALGSS